MAQIYKEGYAVLQQVSKCPAMVYYGGNNMIHFNREAIEKLKKKIKGPEDGQANN